MKIKIEKIPLPKRVQGRKPKYPFTEMRVGDSFALKSERDFVRARTAAYMHAMRTGKSFLAKAEELRIWRTK